MIYSSSSMVCQAGANTDSHRRLNDIAYKPVGPRAKCYSYPQNSYILRPEEHPAHNGNCHQVAQTASSIDKRLLLVAPMINQRSNNKEGLYACG
jgi:hypothetical protein